MTTGILPQPHFELPHSNTVFIYRFSFVSIGSHLRFVCPKCKNQRCYIYHLGCSVLEEWTKKRLFGLVMWWKRIKQETFSYIISTGGFTTPSELQSSTKLTKFSVVGGNLPRQALSPSWSLFFFPILLLKSSVFKWNIFECSKLSPSLAALPFYFF